MMRQETGSNLTAAQYAITFGSGIKKLSSGYFAKTIRPKIINKYDFNRLSNLGTMIKNDLQFTQSAVLRARMMTKLIPNPLQSYLFLNLLTG